MADDLPQAKRWRPPGRTCSRCGKPYVASAAGWHWLGDERLELICPGCTTQIEADELLGRGEQRSHGAPPAGSEH
jgi:hypothetical protein